MSTANYKCPCCASSLVYDGTDNMLACPACSNRFELDAIEAINTETSGSTVDFATPTQGFADAEIAMMQGYRCKNCGAELITEETTTATECPYCGSPTILPDRIDGGVKPEKVIPFVITKEEAQQKFMDYFKGKKLLPNVFVRSDNQIAEIRKLYVPYWLFDCEAQCEATYMAEKKQTRREGDWEVEKTEHFLVQRKASMSFCNIPVDGSEKLDNDISESLEPYDLSKAVPFRPAVLAGAMADHADVNAEDCERRAVERVESSISNRVRNSVTGYTSVNERSKTISSQGGKVTPVLMPVWLIITIKEGKTYTFAINGQTGKLTCNVPTNKKKAFLWGAGIFGSTFGLGALVLWLLKKLASGSLLITGLIAAFITLIVVCCLIGQLNQAVRQSEAADYVDDFQLPVKEDRFLYSNTKRKKIETQPETEAKAD